MLKKPQVLGNAPNGTPGLSSTLNEIKPYGRPGPSKYPYRLSFYGRPPLEEVTTDEFETFAIDRLKVLADIETGQSRNKSPDELRQVVNNRLKAVLPLSANSARNVDLESERKKDAVGHFVLRLAVCRSEDLRSRFVRAETMLFRIRYEQDDLFERDAFLDSLQFEWVKVTPEEKAAHKDKIIAASSHLRDLKERFESETFFKVHWTKVTELIDRRRVYVKDGQAYVPARDQTAFVMAEFSSSLERALEMTSRAMPRLDEDDRLLPVLNHLSLSFLAGMTSDWKPGEDGHGDGTKVTAQMVDELARKHFPLCMKNLYDTLKEKHHLRHQGRLQFTLFLKGIGMDVDETMAFWRKSFSMVTEDKFNKEYRYNVRHNYGLEGGRKNYPPMNCQKILTGPSPGTQEAHGCPFRHFGDSALASAVTANHPTITSSELRDILAESKEKGHFHLGCTRLFELRHGLKKGEGLAGDVVSHPNQYFDRSRYLEKVAKGDVDVKMEAETT